MLAGSGHIAGVVNPPAKKKYQFWTGAEAKGTLENWLKNAEEHPGSWWPYWDQWIRSHDDAKVKARKPGANRVKILEDAPGSFVMTKV